MISVSRRCEHWSCRARSTRTLHGEQLVLRTDAGEVTPRHQIVAEAESRDAYYA